MRATPWLVSLAVVVLSVTSCDWNYFAFTNSIPFQGKNGAEFRIYLGVDGLSYRSVQAARAKGAFSGPNWKVAKFISMFPATSDASWTRILHTAPVGGYEIEYYSPSKDAVMNKGLPGLLKHILPNFAESINFEAKYLTAFDYRGNGFTHTIGAYHDTFVNLSESFDNLFITLDGRAQTANSFTGYLLEFDVMGHMQTFDDITRSLEDFSQRIETFRERHPHRKITFTLFADHGLDFVQVSPSNLIEFDYEMPKVGVTSVTSLGNRDPDKELYAVPIMHTRVTYLALHTHPKIIEKVSVKLSQVPSADLVAAKLSRRDDGLDWYAIWAEGKMVASYGFDRASDRYVLSAEGDYQRLGLSFSFPSGASSRTFTDDELFRASKDATYPDLFYRVRTGLANIGLQHPAEILVSFRPGYASMGFKLPGFASDMVISGFHGSLETRGSMGALITDECDIPEAVRSENIFDLFPAAKEHLRRRGVEWVDGDSQAALDYVHH